MYTENLHLYVVCTWETGVSRSCLHVSRERVVLEGGWSGGTLSCLYALLFLHTPPNPLTLCLEISVLTSFLSPGSCAAHSHINSSTNRWRNAHLRFTLTVSISPRQWKATPHILKVSAFNFLLTESCFHVSCSGGGRLFIVTQHTAMLNQQSHSKRVRTLHFGTELQRNIQGMLSKSASQINLLYFVSSYCPPSSVLHGVPIKITMRHPKTSALRF